MKVNLVGGDIDRDARRTTVIVAVVFSLFVAVASALGAAASYQSVGQTGGWLPNFRTLVGGDFLPTPTRPSDVLTASKDPFATADQRLNVLLLGIGGEGHEGSQLTDTIIYASIDRKTNKVALVSIPRDLGVPLGGRTEKINAINAYAEKEHPGEGPVRTAQALSELFQVRIDRVVRVDFRGFAKFVDALGGIEVDVPRAFTDREYPTPDEGPNPYQYTTVSFKAGKQTMDGTTALQYARSRHGNNGEGGDFARARRQQLVIEGIRRKVLALGTLGDPRKVSSLWETVSAHLSTDISAWDLLKILPAASELANAEIVSQVIDDEKTGLLTYGEIRGYLAPRDPSWGAIRTLLADPFRTPEIKAAELKPTQPVTVEIRNGTFITGLAGEASETLKTAGYTIASTGNAASRNYEKSVIYDITGGKNPEDLAKLKKLLDANVSATPLQNGTVADASGRKENLSASSTDFLIILGTSSKNVLK